MMLMAVPLVLLYFGGVAMCRLMPRAEAGGRDAERLTLYRESPQRFPASVFAWRRLRYDGGRGGIGQPTFSQAFSTGASDHVRQ